MPKGKSCPTFFLLLYLKASTNVHSSEMQLLLKHRDSAGSARLHHVGYLGSQAAAAPPIELKAKPSTVGLNAAVCTFLQKAFPFIVFVLIYCPYLNAVPTSPCNVCIPGKLWENMQWQATNPILFMIASQKWSSNFFAPDTVKQTMHN